MSTDNHVSWRELIKHIVNQIIVSLLLIFLTLSSAYLIWGWITIEDLRKYCATNSMDFETTMTELISDFSAMEMSADKNFASVKLSTSGHALPISRYIFPFTTAHTDKESISISTGSFLEPVLLISENTRNTSFCFGIGYLVGLFMVSLEHLQGKKPTKTRLILRPILGGTASMLLFIVIISGGALMWNEVNGVKGLSVGLIAVIGSLYYEKFSKLVVF